MEASTLQLNTQMGMRAKFIADTIARTGKVDVAEVRQQITHAAETLGTTYGPVSKTVYGLLKGNPDVGQPLADAFKKHLLA